jgi:Zn-finger nucleic acid-binding protein
MKCPTCTDQTLVMADRSGIEIDYCPACRGVWLDRGELDKIIERSTTVAAPAAPPVAPSPVATAPVAAAPSPTPPPMPSPTGHAPLPQPRPQRWDDDVDDDDDDDDDRRRYDPRYGGKPKKKKRAMSIFEEIFDF